MNNIGKKMNYLPSIDGLKVALFWSIFGYFEYIVILYISKSDLFAVLIFNILKFTNALLLFPFAVILIGIIDIIRILIISESSMKMDNVNFIIPGVFSNQNPAKKYVIPEILTSILLIPFVYLLFRLLEKISVLAFQVDYQSDLTVWIFSSTFLMYFVLLLLFEYNSFGAIKEDGIIYQSSLIKWKQILNYQWLSSGSPYHQGFPIQYKAPRGMTALKIQYYGHNLMYASECNILIPNVSKLPIEEILVSKLPNLSLKLSDALIFPLYTWDYGFRIKNELIQLPYISLGEQGVFFEEHMIPWSAISAYQWCELKDCKSLKSLALRLYNRKKYRILRVQRIKKQRSQWLEIPVPGSQVTQAHELLVKYLPDYVQINQPPSSG